MSTNTTQPLTPAELRKMLAHTPGVSVWCTGSQYVISVYDEDAKVWTQHAQPCHVNEKEAIRKALGIE